MNWLLQSFANIIERWFVELGLSVAITNAIATTIIGATVVSGALLLYFVVRTCYNLLIKKIVKRTTNKLDDYIFSHPLFSHLLYYLPTLFVYGIFSSYLSNEQHIVLLNRIASIIFILLTARNLHLFFQMFHVIYNRYPFASRRPIKGIVQVMIIFVYIIAATLCVTTLLAVSPLSLLGGIGAISAVLLLIFKDPILGLVSGIQLTANNMIQIGDWIEIPEYHADGEVIDITMQTVRVRNWNKTIVSLPVYSLISQSFVNWSGMKEAGGRRIKRSISIDINSVKFCDKKTLAQFKKFSIIKDYIIRKEKEIQEYNATHKIDFENDVVSSRALTNLGTFREYVYSYLYNHPKISNDLTLMVRHLALTPQGIPIEIYAFCSDTEWEKYESIQADIFDHIIAATKKFGLKIYQSLSGSEVVGCIDGLARHKAL